MADKVEGIIPLRGGISGSAVLVDDERAPRLRAEVWYKMRKLQLTLFSRAHLLNHTVQGRRSAVARTPTFPGA